MSRTTALIRVTTKRERGQRPVMEIELPERIMREIRRVRPKDMVLNLGKNESVTISSDVFKRVIEGSIKGRRR